MNAPRLLVDTSKITHNTRRLVEQLHPCGISVTGVTKACLGMPAVAEAMLAGGVNSLGDSRLGNIAALRAGGIETEMVLVRSPMLSQVADVVRLTETSLNTEIEVIEALSIEAVRQRRSHNVVIMVELGDLREGLPVRAVHDVVGRTLRCPGITLAGIGTNLGCLSGVTPDRRNMGELERLVESIESTFAMTLDRVSGGSSASLEWALGNAPAGRVDNLRLGESILLGREPLHRRPLPDLYLDAFTLVAEVIESQVKPSRPWGTFAQDAAGHTTDRPVDRGDETRAIVALGRQDTDPTGLVPPTGTTIRGASSDHLVVTSQTPYHVGDEVRFGLDYGALVRAMTSPHVDAMLSGNLVGV